MGKVLCSTGALIGRPNGRDYRLLEGCMDRLHCDGFEFMLYDSWYPEIDALSVFLGKLSLPVSVFHCEKRVGELIGRNEPGDMEEALSKFRVNCELASFLGADRMVLHLWNGIQSDEHFPRHLAAFEKLHAIAKADGITLTVENVVCAYGDPMDHWQKLKEAYPEVCFTFDTKMAAFHGQTDLIFGEEFRWLWDGKHIRHLHVNDYSGGYMDWQNLKTLHVGKGRIDFESFFDGLRERNYQGDYTVEATSFLPDGVIHWEDLNATFARIRDYIR